MLLNLPDLYQLNIMEKHEYIEDVLDHIGIGVGFGRNTLGTVLGRELPQDLIAIGNIVREYREEISLLDNDQRIALVAQMAEVLTRREEKLRKGRLLTLEAECFEPLNGHSPAQVTEDLARLKGRGRYAETLSPFEAEVVATKPSTVTYRLGRDEPTVYV